MFANGGAPTKIVDAGYPSGIGLDPSNQQLFFTDNLTDTITRIAHDGSAPPIIHHNTNAYSNPRAIVVRR
jgi:sugar lactone lactonase YvrE